MFIFDFIKLYFNSCCNILDQSTDYAVFIFNITHKHKNIIKKLKSSFKLSPIQ
jgi:hypothetical protein